MSRKFPDIIDSIFDRSWTKEEVQKAVHTFKEYEEIKARLIQKCTPIIKAFGWEFIEEVFIDSHLDSNYVVMKVVSPSDIRRSFSLCLKHLEQPAELVVQTILQEEREHKEEMAAERLAAAKQRHELLVSVKSKISTEEFQQLFADEDE